MKETERLLSEALALPNAERVVLVEGLLSSLDNDTDVDIELAWQQEIQRRLAEIDSGAVTCVPWEEVRDRADFPTLSSTATRKI